jgi:hypothetical protein
VCGVKGKYHCGAVTGTESAEEVQRKKTTRALFIYPIASIILWILPSVSRVYEIWLPPIFVLVACRVRPIVVTTVVIAPCRPPKLVSC